MIIDDLKKPCPGDFCLLCGGNPEVIGVFIPKEPSTWGGAPGRSRLICYCLCSSCQNKPDAPIRAEKIIRAELGGGANHA